MYLFIIYNEICVFCSDILETTCPETSEEEGGYDINYY